MAAEPSNSPQEILKLATVHYKVVAVIVAVCTVIGYMETRDMKPSYRSEAVLVVDTQQFVESDTDASNDVRDLDILTTLVGRIKTTPALRHVIGFAPELQEYLEVDMSDPRSINDAAKDLGSVIDADLRGDSLFIDLTAKSGDRNLAYLAAKYVSTGYTNFLRTISKSKAMGGVDNLNRGMKLALEDLETAQNKLITFQKKLEFTNLKERKEELETKNNTERLELDKLRSDIAKIKTDLTSLVSVGYSDPNLKNASSIELTDQELEKVILISSVLQNEDFKSIYTLYKAAKSSVRNLEVDLKSEHPTMKAANRKVEQTRKVLVETISDIPKSLNAQIELKTARVKELEYLIKEQTNQLFDWEQKYMQQQTIEKELEIAREQIDSRKDQIQSVEFTSEAEGTQIELAEEASEPSTIQPNKNQTIMMGFLAGLGLSYGFLYVIHMMDKSIKSVEQAEQVLQLPVLAAVPVSELDGQQATSRLIMINSPNSTCSEAFRSLRVNIESMARQKSNKVVLFTSSMPSEGKTFTSINYAASLAQQGHRTLLIDMDLRKPAVGPEFKLKHDHVGVTDLLQSKEKLDQFPDLAIYEATERFFVLHGGPHIDNPAEHLSGYAIEKIVEKARENFDRVVIDSAPLGPVGDTLAVARLADMLCLVVRSAKTTSKVILRIIDTLHRHGHTPAGIVLNFLQNKTGKGSYYYYYSSDKEKEYTKSGYQRKQKPKKSSEMPVAKEDPKKKLSEFDNPKIG